MDRLDTFRIFTRVAEVASFTKAADNLNLPRSTVSTAVQALEARIGARLLSRTTRRVSLTEDGKAFYERCTRLLGDLDEAETLFRRSATPSGKLRIDVPARIGRLIIAPALPDFFAHYPDVEIDMGVTDRPIDLVQEGVDCAIRVGTLSDSGLIARQIGTLDIVTCASPSYLAKHGLPKAPEDLGRHWAVNYASPATGRIEPWECVRDGQVRTVAMRARVTVNSAEAYIACCVAGLGLIQIPAYDARDLIAAGQLREVLRRYRATPMPVSVLYPHRRHLSQRLRVFVDWIAPLFHKL
jgi:DNA-binding transcriptional LysR family regulator